MGEKKQGDEVMVSAINVQKRNQEEANTFSQHHLLSSAFMLVKHLSSPAFVVMFHFPFWVCLGGINSNVLPPPHPQSSILYNRNVTQSDKKFITCMNQVVIYNLCETLAFRAGSTAVEKLFRVSFFEHQQHPELKKKLNAPRLVRFLFFHHSVSCVFAFSSLCHPAELLLLHISPPDEWESEVTANHKSIIC